MQLGMCVISTQLGRRELSASCVVRAAPYSSLLISSIQSSKKDQTRSSITDGSATKHLHRKEKEIIISLLFSHKKVKEFLVFSMLRSRHELEGIFFFFCTLNDALWEAQNVPWLQLCAGGWRADVTKCTHQPLIRPFSFELLLFQTVYSVFVTLFQCVCEVRFCDRRLHSCQIGCVSDHNWSSFHCTLSWNIIHTQRHFKKSISPSCSYGWNWRVDIMSFILTFSL